jgi:hypothetical protein
MKIQHIQFSVEITLWDSAKPTTPERLWIGIRVHTGVIGGSDQGQTIVGFDFK